MLMDKLKVLIVEDEFIIAESLKDIVEDLGYEVVGMAIRAEEAIELLEAEQPDLAILDITLKGEKDGIWLAEQIKANHKIPYIFLSSHGDQSTVQRAVKTKPYGYLMKPFQKADIYTAISLALSNYENERNQTPAEIAEETSNIIIKNSIFIKDGHLFVKLPFHTVLFVKADGNYLEIHTDSKRRLIKSSLKEFIKKLPQHIFMQAHRSYVVNVEKVESFGATVLNINQHEIPISANYKDELVAKLMTL